MTRRERMERRAERLQAWAAKRQQGAAEVFKRNEPYTSDIAFNTQPGHIPARARIIAQEDRAFQSLEKAKGMESRAAGLESALERAVFSDDEDAVHALEARAQKNEATRDRMKAANKIIRRNPKNQLTEEKVKELLGLGLDEPNARRAFEPDFCGRIGFPDYELTNLGARIRGDRERIKILQVRQERTKQAESSPNGVTVEGTGEYIRVTFSEKPERSILDALRGAGFSWGSGSWTGKRDSLPDCVSELLSPPIEQPDTSTPLEAATTAPDYQADTALTDLPILELDREPNIALLNPGEVGPDEEKPEPNPARGEVVRRAFGTKPAAKLRPAQQDNLFAPIPQQALRF